MNLYAYLPLIAGLALLLCLIVAGFLLSRLLSYWLEAYMCGADVAFSV